MSNGTLTDNSDGTISINTSGSGGTPGGANANVQYNDGGSFGGESALSWNEIANTLSISRDAAQTGYALVISSDNGTTTLANISHDGTAYVNGLQINALNVGSVLFNIGTGISQDNANFYWDDSNNRLGLGVTPTAKFHVVAGTLTDTANPGISYTATMPAAISQSTRAVNFEVTGAGSSSQENDAMRIAYGAGYTGNSYSIGLNISNSNAGTGTSLSGGAANYGAYLQSVATTTGTNFGFFGDAGGGNVNSAVYGLAARDKNSAKNIGVTGFANNGGSSPVVVGGWFGLSASPTAPTVSGALLANNGSIAADIFRAEDNGTAVFTIGNDGNFDTRNRSLSWSDLTNTLSISADASQTGYAFVISADTGLPVANISHDGAVFVPTVNTGQGDNELYDMNQDVLTTSSPTFAALTLSSPLTVGNGGTGATSHTDGAILVGDGTNAITNLGVLAKGVILVGDGTTEPTLLAVGANGTILSADSGETSGVKWIAAPPSPLTTKGDIYTFGTAATRLAVGSNGQILSADSSTATGLVWVSPPTTSAALAAQITDETGSGSLFFGTSGTLTTPRFADLGYIADSSGNEQLVFDQTSSAVNHIIISNDITGKYPTISAAGDNASVGLRLGAKGTGTISCDHAFVGRVVELTDAATIATDASLGNTFRVTLGGNRTLGAPTNASHGQRAVWIISQDATGTRTLSYSDVFRFGSDVTSPTLSTAAGKNDYIGAVYNVRSATRASWDVVAVSLGYSAGV